ncbi:MAG: hypothetical protein ACLTVB_00020 [Sutterella sp.]
MLNSKEEAFPSEASINSHPQTPAGAHPHAHRATPAGEVPHAMPAGAKPAAGMSHSASMMQTMKNMSKDDIPPSMSGSERHASGGYASCDGCVIKKHGTSQI